MQEGEVKMNQTTLVDAEIGKMYTIKKIETDDSELDSFLFTLGCYEGESIVVVSVISESFVVSIKDSRYNINSALAKAIII